MGLLRLVTCWPLPDRELAEAAARAAHLLVLENNRGQMFPYIKAACGADAGKVRFMGPANLGQIQEPGSHSERHQGDLVMNVAEHPLRKYMRPHVTRTTTCPGCGIGIVSQAILRAIDDLGLSMDDFVFVAGIGCSAGFPPRSSTATPCTPRTDARSPSPAA